VKIGVVKKGKISYFKNLKLKYEAEIQLNLKVGRDYREILW
jgi:hypothetical protein